jgi:hypothetical protein
LPRCFARQRTKRDLDHIDLLQQHTICANAYSEKPRTTAI